MNILYQLNKSPYMNGITGLSHLDWMETWMGRKDYRDGQLCNANNQYLTPFIIKKINYFDAYQNQVYLNVIKELDPIYQSVASMSCELHHLEEKEELIEGKGRQIERENFEIKKREALKQEERLEILLKLSKIYENMQDIDVALHQHLEKAKKVFQSKISAYWKGILMENKNEYALPVYPVDYENEIEEKLNYEIQWNHIMDLLKKVFMQEEYEYV